MTDDALKAAWAASTGPDQGPAGGPCPSPEAILELAERSVGASSETDAAPPPASLLLHLATCASCRHEMELTRSLLRAAMKPEGEDKDPGGGDATAPPPRGPVRSPPAGRSSTLPWLRMAAGVVLVAGAAGIWQAARPGGPGDVRRGAPETLMVVDAVCPSPGRLVLTWEPVEGADRYRAELSGGDGREVDSASTAGARAELDATEVAGDADARWRMRAEGPLGPVAASRAAPLPAGCG